MLALTLVTVVVASGAVGTVSAATFDGSGSADPVEIGQSGVSQTVTFTITLDPSETTTVTIATDLASGLGSEDASVSSAGTVTSSNGLVTAGTSSLSSGGDITFTLEETDGSTQTTTVTVELTVDASSQTTEATGVQYTIDESSGATETVSFDLQDTTPPSFDSATTGDSASGSSTARDKITLTFVEDGTGIDASTVSAADFTISGASGQTVDSVSVSGNEVVLTLSGNLATDATPTVDIGNGGIDDNAGNSLSTASQTATDGLSPRQTGWAYDDGDADGTVDFIRITFSEDLDEGSLTENDWTVTDPGDPNISNPTTPNLVDRTLYFNVTADADVTGTQTGKVDTPRVQYAGTSVADTTGNNASTTTEGYKDVADPVVKTVSSVDADADGQVDRIDVTFTEQISSGKSSAADAGDFTIGGTDNDSVTKGSLTVPGDGPTVELGVTGPVDDTALSLTLDYSASTIRRDNANIAYQFSGVTVEDGAAPVVTGATTLDRDGDGSVDAATLTFTESLSDATVTASEFSIGGQAAEAVDTLSTGNDDTLQMRITTDGNEVSGTDTKEVTHSAGSTADVADNTLGAVESGDVTESDGAAPVVTGFSLDTDDANHELDVSFDASESLSTVSVSLTGPESGTLTSFSTSGSTYTTSVAVGTNGDYTATLDTADDAAGNSLASTPSDTAAVSFVPRKKSSVPSALSGTSSKVRVSGSTGLSEVGVNFGGAAGGTVRATGVNSLGENTPPGTFVTAADITVPDTFTETASTLKFALSRERLADLGVDASSLTVYRLHDGSWQALETRIVDRGDDTIVVEADTPGFSRFAVMAGETPGASSTATSTSTSAASGNDDGADGADDSSDGAASTTSSSAGDASDATSTQIDDEGTNGTETSTQTPGFGVGVALVALLSVLALASRQRD